MLPDVLLLDLRMPKRDGLEVLRILKRTSQRDGLRVLMLSGHTQSSIEARARRDGADDYLTKPFAPEELVSRVRKLDPSSR